MNFSKFDIVLIVTMSIAVIGMSFTFPALGLTDQSDETAESDIPEFDIQNDRFDFASSFPANPGTPSGGELSYNQSGDDNREVTLHEDSSNNYETWLVFDAEPTSDTLRVTWYEDDAGNLTTNRYWFNESETHTDQQYDMEVRFELLEADKAVDNATSGEMRYTILDEPSGSSGFLDRIPIVGGVVDAGDSLASIVGWIGSVIWWFTTTFYEVTLNTIGMLYDATSYMFEMAAWLIGTYSSIISAAESWASVFVAVPGVLLMLELAKMVMIGISLLPTT